MRSFFRRAARSRRRVGILLAAALLAAPASVAATAAPAERTAAAAQTSGYWLVGTDGGIFSFGKAAFYGSTGSVKLNQPIVGMAATPDGRGYWMVAADGGIFSFGSAGFYGSTGGMKLNQPIVGMAATRTGKGYWLVAADGGIFAFGDAGFFGSTGNVKLNRPIVDIVPTPGGRGYWMAASDGGIFSFGDAGFFGSTGAVKLAKRIQQMAATPTGKGYWLVAGDGGIFSFGDAGFHGSAVDGGAEKRIVDMAPSASGKGYYLTASNGAVYAYGDAKPHGGLENQKLAHGIIAMVALNGGEPPVAVDDVLEIFEDGSGTIDLLANDRDPDGGPLTLQSISGSPRATITASGGTITYKPGADLNGNDSFIYTVADERGNTAIGTVTVRIRPIDDLPAPVEDTITVALGQTVTINVLANDVGLGDGLSKLVPAPAFMPAPGRGKATLSSDGAAIVYTAEKRGPDTLYYQVIDNDGDDANGTVKITVVGPDKVPQAVDVTHECRTDCVVDVLAAGATLGDDGDIRLVDPDQAGVKLVNKTKISFTGGAAHFEDVAVEYEIADDDGTGQVDPGIVTFSFRNSAPTGVTESVPASASGIYQLRGEDADGDALTYFVDDNPEYFDRNSFNPADGTFSLVGTPAPGEHVTIQFRVFDGLASSEARTLTIVF